MINEYTSKIAYSKMVNAIEDLSTFAQNQYNEKEPEVQLLSQE